MERAVKEAVLVATLGAAPQVITLTLDALLERGEPLRRVYVVHTDATISPISSALNRLDATFNSGRYPANLHYAPFLLMGTAGPLPDVVSLSEIEAAYRALYQLLRQLKHSGLVVHLCLAGGRKTMTAFALAAAQVVLEPEDRVWHLTSSPNLVEGGAMHARHREDVQLIPIPLILPGRLHSDDGDKARAFLASLTEAERELTVLLVQGGLNNAELALALGKSPKTVANQLSSIYSKLRDHYSLETTPDRTLLMALVGRYS